MEHMGHIIITLRAGEARPHIPNHIDFVFGAARAANRFDIPSIDRILERWGGGFRASGVYTSRLCLGRIGMQNKKFDSVEENIGLSRTYRIQIAEETMTRDTIKGLRDLAEVETTAIQTFSTAPLTSAKKSGVNLTKRQIWEPFHQINADKALKFEPGDERVTVAVVDTGVSLGHPEIQRKLLAGYDTVALGIGRLNKEMRLVGDSQGRDFTPQDGTGHGSHVTGIIGAQGWQIPPGVGGKSLILPIRALAAARFDKGPKDKLIGIGSQSDIDSAIKIATDLGADVINMSLGTTISEVEPGAPRPHASVIEYADHYGCVLVAAAGNSGRNEHYYPAALPQVISVGSVDRYKQRSHFSTWGKHLTLMAPGENILSLGLRDYMTSSGTSHAAPYTSGVAALMISRARKSGRELKGEEVKQLLIESTVPLSNNGFDPQTGHGLLDAYRALQTLDRNLKKDPKLGQSREKYL